MTRTLHIKTATGKPVLIRPLDPGDEDALREAIGNFSNRSRYLRFFSNLTPVPEPIVHKLADVDGQNHLAWVAIDERAPGKPIIGAVHAMRETPGQDTADFAIGLLDDWHGEGLARLLIALLCAEAREKNVAAMTADVLWENRKGRALMKAIAAVSTGTDSTVVSYRFEPDETLATLRDTMRGDALQAVFDAIETGSLVSSAA